ncbi:hypothetical protein ABW19_dt0207134 [Dactylella cylindrospora]|nr:hypothetical protein ABW19_dt0207134 [Dactylella cylindrospora]
MPSKSVAATPRKSPKPSKSKAPISSEYISDSDLESDESMTEAPLAKPALSKSTEKTSKKRNRDGTEKVNGAAVAPPVAKKAVSAKVAVSTPKSQSKTDAKATNGAKKSKKVEVVESSEESSGSESESESGSENPSEGDEDNSDSPSESESESEESESMPAPPPTTTPKSFKLPLASDVPPGFTPLEATSPNSIPSSLDGKQIFLFTAPSRLNFSDVKKIKLHGSPDGETIQAGEARFTIRRAADPASSGMKVILPRDGKKGYKLASVTPSAQFFITEAPPTTQSSKPTKVSTPGPRAQPEGLRMRFMPAGYGEESDIHINRAVLPRMDLVADDGDVIMDDVDSAPTTPKKSKEGEEAAGRSTPGKEKKKSEKAPEEEPRIEEGDDKKSKKEKKHKHKDREEKKEKKSKNKDEDGKKEKKKHKKDKAEA